MKCFNRIQITSHCTRCCTYSIIWRKKIKSHFSKYESEKVRRCRNKSLLQLIKKSLLQNIICQGNRCKSYLLILNTKQLCCIFKVTTSGVLNGLHFGCQIRSLGFDFQWDRFEMNFSKLFLFLYILGGARSEFCCSGIHKTRNSLVSTSLMA